MKIRICSLMKRKIRKYLNSIDTTNYHNLNSILDMHLNQDIKKQLEELGFLKVEIYIRIKKNGNEYILNMFYSNLFIDIQFFDKDYDYVIYNRGITPDELEDSIITKKYTSEFYLNDFIHFILKKVQSDKRFRRGEPF